MPKTEAGKQLLADIRELAQVIHHTGNLRDHNNPNDKTGWNLGPIETCEDLYCIEGRDASDAIDAIEREASLKPSAIGYNFSDLLADELEVGKSYEVEMEDRTTAILRYDGYLTGCGEKTCIHHQKKSLYWTTQDNSTPAGHMCISKVIRRIK